MNATKAIIKAYVKHQLSINPTWALKGLLEIYARQTSDEQASGTTNKLNSVGFSGADAEILSSFAVQYQKWNRLSDKQMALVFKKMPRYAGQLISLITPEKMEAVKVNAVKYAQTLVPQTPAV